MDRAEFICDLKEDIKYSESDRKKIIQESIKSESSQKKSIIIMEELAELIQQISKQLRMEGDYFQLLEEIADVHICLDMLSLIYFIKNESVERAIDVKLRREHERIKRNQPKALQP